ncbi:MAG: homoserine kinase [Thermoleophilia bacterium]|nr:homoserine kinase [Thermoleophilia bacterium]
MAATQVMIDVPGSSANLGPGYDCLAIALPFRLRVWAERRPGPLSVHVSGEGAASLPQDASNLVASTLLAELDERGDDLAITIENEIPLGAGCGSSAAAIVAALAVADLLRGRELSNASLVLRASAIEGHPDNVAASVLGGITIAAGDPAVARRIDPPAGLGLVVVVADERVATSHARAALSPDVPRSSAVWNVQHAALLVHALHTGSLEDLSVAFTDRLHQDAREPLMPTFAALRHRTAELGALGVTLSGAGPSVLIWCAADATEQVAESIRTVVPTATVYAVRPESSGLVAS